MGEYVYENWSNDIVEFTPVTAPSETITSAPDVYDASWYQPVTDLAGSTQSIMTGSGTPNTAGYFSDYGDTGLLSTNPTGISDSIMNAGQTSPFDDLALSGITAPQAPSSDPMATLKQLLGSAADSLTTKDGKLSGLGTVALYALGGIGQSMSTDKQIQAAKDLQDDKQKYEADAYASQLANRGKVGTLPNDPRTQLLAALAARSPSLQTTAADLAAQEKAKQQASTSILNGGTNSGLLAAIGA